MYLWYYSGQDTVGRERLLIYLLYYLDNAPDGKSSGTPKAYTLVGYHSLMPRLPPLYERETQIFKN